MASAARGSEGSEERLAPDGRERQELVSRYCEFTGHQEARAFHRKNVRAFFDALIRRSGAVAARDLREFYEGYPSSMPKQGLYTETEFTAFWKNEARPNLVALPGVEAAGDGDGLRFVGIGPDHEAVEGGEYRPLDELRNDPRVRARRTAEDLHGPQADVTEELLDLWDRIARSSPVTTEELERDFRLPEIEEYGDPLEALPHIEREREAVSAEDVRLDELETVAELRAAEERIQAPPTETWRFNPDA